MFSTSVTLTKLFLIGFVLFCDEEKDYNFVFVTNVYTNSIINFDFIFVCLEWVRSSSSCTGSTPLRPAETLPSSPAGAITMAPSSTGSSPTS